MLVRVYERYISGIDWLHGFYAFSSYSQIDMTDSMDAVSLGWARLELDDSGTPWINTTTVNDNDWTIPLQSEDALNHFKANGTPYNLNIFSTSADILAAEQSRRTAAEAIGGHGAGLRRYHNRL